MHPISRKQTDKALSRNVCGRGRASMIVNINQCASTYDETLNVMKFSAVARQVCEDCFSLCNVSFAIG